MFKDMVTVNLFGFLFSHRFKYTIDKKTNPLKELRTSVLHGEWKHKVLYSVKIKNGKKEYQTKKVRRLRKTLAIGAHKNDVYVKFDQEFIFQLYLESEAIISKDQVITLELIETM